MIPLAQSLSLSQWFNYWMNELNQYEPILYFDWDTMINLIEKEPLAMTAVGIAFLNILLTIIFKVSDYFKEALRERMQRGRLHIEAYAFKNQKTIESDGSEIPLQVVLTNTGRETIVIRDIGYQKRSLLKRVIHHVSPFSIQPVYLPFDRTQCKTDLLNGQDQSFHWPIAIQPREFFEFKIQGALLEQLKKRHHPFTVRDSLNTLWLYRGSSFERISGKQRASASAHQQPAKAPGGKTIQPRALQAHEEDVKIVSSNTKHQTALFDPGQPVNLMLLDQNLLHFDTTTSISETTNTQGAESHVLAEASTMPSTSVLEPVEMLGEK
ncbi:MAG: hypothetical protein VKJ04_10005 [Vampirovibrionales bacterium]|nr:hypothetical protein [Vampirovibrionales bacterium]